MAVFGNDRQTWALPGLLPPILRGPSTKNSRAPAIGVISNLREPHIGARIRLAYAACFCQLPQVSDSHHKQLSMRINAHPPR